MAWDALQWAVGAESRRRVELSDADNVAIMKPNRKWRAAYTTSLTTIARAEEFDNQSPVIL